jgi:hypothetical protein
MIYVNYLNTLGGNSSCFPFHIIVKYLHPKCKLLNTCILVIPLSRFKNIIGAFAISVSTSDAFDEFSQSLYIFYSCSCLELC